MAATRDNFEDASDMAATTPPGVEQSAPETDNEGGETTLIPKSMLGGKECKAGDELRFRVVKEHEGEVEVAFDGYDEKGEVEAGSGEEAPAESPAPSFYD